jgi:hypothetical protein
VHVDEPTLHKEQVQIAVGLDNGLPGGALADGAQHLGILLDDMLGAGVSADGGSEEKFRSIMRMAILSDRELTPIRWSKRNTVAADVGSLDKAEKRVAVKNLEDSQGNLCNNSFCSLSNFCIKENLEGLGIIMGANENMSANSIVLL